jgi:uncharacterized protein (TIGR03083 family)
MPYGPVLTAFGAEAVRLSTELLDLAPEDWSRATACPPWTVADLLGHVLTVVGWLPGMLSAPAPDRPSTSAAGYYRPDARFSARTNARRVTLAIDRAAGAGDGHALAAEFDAAWRDIVRLCAREPADRVVLTRHGDAMLLTDFLVTRIVEVGIHGLDLAAALGRAPWLTPPAARVLTGLLLDGADARAVSGLGWDDVTFLSKATNREPLTAAEADHLGRCGVRFLALG